MVAMMVTTMMIDDGDDDDDEGEGNGDGNVDGGDDNDDGEDNGDDDDDDGNDDDDGDRTCGGFAGQRCRVSMSFRAMLTSVSPSSYRTVYCPFAASTC
jgi:hypothetical protein